MFIAKAYAETTAPSLSSETQATTQVAGQAQMPPQPSPFGMLVPFGAMFLVIYFLIIRPQQKKMKEHQATLEKIKHGDEIISASGLFGKVMGITDKVLTVEIADGVKVKMLKTQVAAVNPDLKNLSTVEKGA